MATTKNPNISVFLRNLSKSPYKRKNCASGVGTCAEMTTSIGGAAFPTVSPTASTSRKSFFDTSAAFGTTISGLALVAVFPVNKKRGHAKQCFVTVQQTLFEVHKNQKDAKNKKTAKHLIDFGDVFNVSIHNEPIQIKDDCICIMDPNTSFFVRPINSEYDLTAWFDWILERSRECRSTKLLRPVFREEFFEAAWDVQIVRRPKLRCDYSKQQPEAHNDDLAEKRTNLLGYRRLCFCGTAFLLFSIGCRPISNVDAPEHFERSAFVELPLNVVSNYGTQERFFFVRIGRCSEIGGGELWMATEHGASARSMHERISQLNLRESERRRAQGIKINLPTVSSSVLKSRAHRERSYTQNQLQKANSQLRLRIVPESARSTCSFQSESAEVCTSRKGSSNSTTRIKKSQHHHASNGSLSATNFKQQLEPIRADSHACRTDSISSGLHSIPEQRVLNEEERGNGEEKEQQEEVASNGERLQSDGVSAKKASIVGLFASRFGAKMSTGACGKPSASNLMDQITAPSSPAARTVSNSFEFGHCAAASLANLASSVNQSARNSLVNSVLGFRLARNNSNANAASTNRKIIAQKTPINSASATTFNAQPSYDCAEDYMTLYDVDDTADVQHQYGYLLNAPSGSVGNRMIASSKFEYRKSSSAAMPYRQFSTGSTGYSSDSQTQQHGKLLGSISATDYVRMSTCKSHAHAESDFSLSEVHSYLPLDSQPAQCWTSGLNEAGNNNELRCSADLASQSTLNEASRTYSLGSKPNQQTVQKSSCVSQSVRPSNAESNHSPQLLHPSSNNSPPNYLKKLKTSQTAKNLHKEALEANFNWRIMHKDGETSFEGKKASVGIMDEASTLSEDKTNEMRIRAHSTGSKALIKSSLKKLTASSAVFHNRKTAGIDEDLSSNDGINSRRNTCEANKSMCSSSTCYPHSEDHVEIDFDRDESPSVSSLPSLHSRNSSIGMMTNGVRSALDSLSREKPSERLIREQIGIALSANNESVQQTERKQSVPEMGSNNNSGSIKNQLMCAEFIVQNRLHPHRRLTYDGSALNIRRRPKEKQSDKQQQLNHINKLGKSPPRCMKIDREPSRQSTSSGISTSKSSESTTTTIADSSQLTSIGYHQCAKATTVEVITERKESDENDYVLMQNMPKKEMDGMRPITISDEIGTNVKPIQQQLDSRTFGTTVEPSFSQCSSLAPEERSCGGTKTHTTLLPQSENAKTKIDDKNIRMLSLSLIDFPDEYHELSASNNKLEHKEISPQQEKSVPLPRSRNPSCSPLTHTRRLPHQLSHNQHAYPSTARTYLPTNEASDNIRLSTLRYVSEFERSTNCIAKIAGKAEVQPHNHGQSHQQLRSERAKKNDGKLLLLEEKDDGRQHNCDYAIITASNIKRN